MDTALLLSALTMGFLGSFHCIGMCGAIALSLPVQHLSGWRKYLGILYYNTGRVLTYGMIGWLSGSIGKAVSFPGWQQKLSIILGLLLLLICCLTLRKKAIQPPAFIQKHWNNRIIGYLAPLFRQPTLRSTFLIGLLNGLLPCGLVYMAIAGAIAVHHPYQGMLFMMSFGAGTMPAMMLVGLTGHMLSLRLRNSIRRSAPYVIGVMGLLLVLRGANLNIPYLSPKIVQDKMQCCHR